MESVKIVIIDRVAISSSVAVVALDVNVTLVVGCAALWKPPILIAYADQLIFIAVECVLSGDRSL